MAETNQQLAHSFCSDTVVLANLAYVENINMFAWWNETFSYFELLDKKAMERKVYLYLYEKVKKNMTMAMVGDIVTQAKMHVTRRFEDVISPYLGLNDFTVLNVRDFSVQQATPNIPCFHYASISSIDLEQDTFDTPVFSAFLKDVLVDVHGNHDKELETFLQEIFGYILLPTLESHASFFFIGKGGNGKSVILDIIRDMMGGDTFCDAKSIDTLTNKEFAASDLLGKRLNICSEEESKYIKSDKFKNLVSGDHMSIRRLYEPGFMWKPTVKYIFSTNDMPSFTGFNRGLLRRIYLLPFLYEIPEDKKDTGITRKILKEIRGITLWALQGSRRIQNQGYKFTIPQSVNDSKGTFEEALSSAVLFCRETFESIGKEAGMVMTKEEMYDEYVAWSLRRGKKALNFYNFFNDLETVKQITKEMYDGNTLRTIRA